MVVQLAGRERRDHNRTFVTDWSLYYQMLGYLVKQGNRNRRYWIDRFIAPDHETYDFCEFSGSFWNPKTGELK